MFKGAEITFVHGNFILTGRIKQSNRPPGKGISFNISMHYSIIYLCFFLRHDFLIIECIMTLTNSEVQK